jgi:hypothetical protein
MSDLNNGIEAANGTVTCMKCGRVSKNAHGHQLHYTLTHGKFKDTKKGGNRRGPYKKKPVIKESAPVNENPGICSLEVPGQIGGQNIMLTVDLSIAATAIRPV